MDVFYLVDININFPELGGFPVYSERLGQVVQWTELPALEAKVVEWSKEHPAIWNVGIGAAASFVRTLTRLLFQRTKGLYGPYDHIIHVRLTPAAAASSSTAQRWLALEVLLEMATRTLKIPEYGELQELKQLAADESYYGYGTIISDSLMLQAFGLQYLDIFEPQDDPSVLWDPNNHYGPTQSFGLSPILERSREAWRDKRHLLLVENLHVPVSLDVLAFPTSRRPSTFQQIRWLISTTSKYVYDKSRQAAYLVSNLAYHLGPEHYHAPPFDGLGAEDWAVLITEALRDAAGSIHNALPQQQRDEEFWLHVAQHCLYYAALYHPLQGAAGRHASATSSVSSDELVRCWVAEDLLFSITSPTDVPAAATGKKHSNYYRSAYEAGKVVIQALQAYSLLPIYSVPTPTRSTSGSSWDVITGVSKIASGVPRLEEDEFFASTNQRDRLRWVSFMDDDGRDVSWDWRRWRKLMKPQFIPGEMTMTTLILRGCSNISAFPFDEVFNHRLRVLDLSYTPINSLPPWFSRLLNLHLLSLRGCAQLQALSPPPSTPEEETPPLAHLENLQVLDMNGVPLLELTQQDGSNKSNLHYLDLSGSRITTLPSQFFSGMPSLEELILGNCSHLKELPPSLAELSNLLILHIEGTQITYFPENTFEAMQRLHTLKLISNMLLTSLPSSLSKVKGLKELHVYDCISLRLQFTWELVSCLEDLYIQAWETLKYIKIHGHPNLRTFSLSGHWIRCLSLRGCSRLKIVNFSDNLTALKDVDLSGTAIEEVPHNLPNLPQLRMLLLLNVPCFKRFPWHLFVRFPKVFYLDHCADDNNQILNMFGQQEICADEDQQREKPTNTAQVNINDSMIFHSFNTDAANKLVKEGQYLQSFNVQVTSGSVRGKEPRNEEGEICTKIQRQSPYLDVHYSEAACIVPMMKLQPRQRHVEISSKNRYPNGLRHLLSVTNSIFITGDALVRCLTDLNYSLMWLEECQLQHCHEMNVVFKMHSEGSGKVIRVRDEYIRSLEVLPSLKILQASNLKNLLSFVEPSDLSYSKLISLKLLKHIHLEHCPRLEKIFPCSLSLPQLQTLIILFCSNLKTIFYKQPKYEVAPSPLPNIERIYLQELPQLQHIHEDIKFQFEMPKWEKLFVRGCRSFRRLPLLKTEYPKSNVEVSGERDWWDKLQLNLREQSHYYVQVPPPEFTLRKKHIIKSYLR